MEHGKAGASHVTAINQSAFRELSALRSGKNMAMNRSAAITASVKMAALNVQDAKKPCSLHRIVPAMPVKQ